MRTPRPGPADARPLRTFVVYEVWTRAKIVRAVDESAALDLATPPARRGLSLCNWHAHEVKAGHAPGADARRRLVALTRTVAKVGR